MRCGFCFAPRAASLPQRDMEEIVTRLAEFGFKKINFAGGEPLLCGCLSRLIKSAKKSGLTTSIVTNGSLLTEKWLESNSRYLDWIGVSIDSINHETNVKHGRYLRHVNMDLDYYTDIFNMVKKHEVRLKINTVVTSYNKNERLHELIIRAKPDKWKIFQVMKMDDVNSSDIDKFLITEKEFDNFKNSHVSLKDITHMVPENNHYMTGSYIMVDPTGRFCDDTTGRYNYSEPIIKIGVEKALSQIKYYEERYEARKIGL